MIFLMKSSKLLLGADKMRKKFARFFSLVFIRHKIKNNLEKIFILFFGNIF